MSAVLSALPRHLFPKPQITAETIFHPLAELIYDQLSKDDSLYLQEDSPAVLLKDHVYVGAYNYDDRATCGQLWKYSLIDKSWDILETPDGAVSGYCLAVWSGKLVLITANLSKMWIRQGEKWECQNIRNMPSGRIVSATTYKTILFAITLITLSSESYLSIVFCDCDKELCWSEPTTGPKVDSYIKASIIVHEMTLYAMVYSHMNGQKSKFLSAPIYDVAIGQLSELSVAGNSFLSRSKLTIFGKRMIVVAFDSSNHLKLYTPFNDLKQTRLSLVEFDELGVEYRSISAVFGLEKSLLVIGKESASGHTTVVKFTSKVAAYDRNSHFTISAFKKLEVVAEIPVLTGDHFGESQLCGIKRFAGFKLYSYAVDAYPANVILYMESWLRRYKESKESIIPPSWGNFLEALQCVKLVDLREKIKNCLETASEVVEAETYEASGIEEMHKLHGQLHQMYDQAHTVEVTDLDVTQQFKEDISKCYRQYSTMSKKIETEMKQLKDENDHLKKDKEQLEKQLLQQTQENLRLQKELAKKGSTVEKSSASHQPSTLTLPNLMTELYKIASKWENIGVFLKIDDGDLQTVKSDYKRDSISCLREMLRIWLKKCDPQPSWQHICDALEILGEEKLAKEIREKYIQ